MHRLRTKIHLQYALFTGTQAMYSARAGRISWLLVWIGVYDEGASIMNCGAIAFVGDHKSGNPAPAGDVRTA